MNTELQENVEQSFTTTKAVLAIILGVISPKISITTVIVTVAITIDILLFPIISRVKAVAMDEANILTMMFPKSIPVSISLGYFNHFLSRLASFGCFRSTSSNELLLKEVNAVSDAENIPDRKTKKTKIAISIKDSLLISNLKLHLPYIYNLQFFN